METLSDIVAQMRGRGEDGRMDRHLWNEYADRIEAAAKRVVVSKTETTTVGNAAAMREALVALTDKVLDYLHKGLIQLPLPLENATAKARAALSAPARQCDVGTAEEQVVRFRDEMVHKCLADEYCRCKDAAQCFARWAQAPYAEEGAGNDK